MRLLVAIVLAAIALPGYADYVRKYQVTITNITKGQTFTPQLLATHSSAVRLFRLGQPASDALAVLAEAGDTTPLTEALLATRYRVHDVQTVPGLLEPGQSVTAVVEGTRHHGFLSVGAMLIPTNDTFVAVDRVRLPFRGSNTVMALAYDAGTEFNDQNCVNIPGPRCNGAAISPPADDDEGFVHVSNGFHQLPPSEVAGEEVLAPFTYDWRNPVARIVVKRLR